MNFIPPVFRPEPPLSINEQNTDLFIHFFGVLKVSVLSKIIQNPTGSRLKSVLSYLLYYKKNSIHRDKLQRRFWPDFSTESGRNNLNVTITHLRKHLQSFIKSDVISFQEDCFVINPQLHIESDAHLFLEYFEKAKKCERLGHYEAVLTNYEAAIEEYKSDFLEDLWHEEWTIPIREELQEKYISALTYVSDKQIEEKRYTQAIESLRQILSKDNCWEEAHRKLILCYGECGKVDRAIRQYHECVRVLNEKLDIAPSKATNEVYKNLKMNMR
jgi:DNA-binding SARP family transcriptional activator